jgi:hypothetical protein
MLAVIIAGCYASAQCAMVAYRHTADSWSAPVAFIAQFCGLVALVGGLVALALNGYVEDYGMTPADTLDTAVELLSGSAVLTAIAWLIALRPTGG